MYGSSPNQAAGWELQGQVESVRISTRTHPTGSGAARSTKTAEIQGIQGYNAIRTDLATTNRDHQVRPSRTKQRIQEKNRSEHLILPKID
jgi:hypothetical protein